MEQEEFDSLNDAIDSEWYPYILEAAQELLEHLGDEYGAELQEMLRQAER